jgi:hypothetical protein
VVRSRAMGLVRVRSDLRQVGKARAVERQGGGGAYRAKIYRLNKMLVHKLMHAIACDGIPNRPVNQNPIHSKRSRCGSKVWRE